MTVGTVPNIFLTSRVEYDRWGQKVALTFFLDRSKFGLRCSARGTEMPRKGDRNDSLVYGPVLCPTGGKWCCAGWPEARVKNEVLRGSQWIGPSESVDYFGLVLRFGAWLVLFVFPNPIFLSCTQLLRPARGMRRAGEPPPPLIYVPNVECMVCGDE